jgi:arabinofuranan 3-O-arabinosyltransferase
MQDPTARLAADQRLLAFSGKRAAQVVFLGASLTVVLTLSMVLTAFALTSETGVKAIAIDVRVFWAAARLVLEGEFLAPFDMARLSAVHNVQPEAWMPWLYPPGYLFLMAPLGLLSFSWGFALWTILSIGLMGLAARPFAKGVVWFAMVLAPAYLPSLVLGQNSLFWLAGLLAALACLRAERWVLAGIIIGCLTLKPQLGLMIPLALLAIGAWRTILAASLTAVIVALGPTLVTGMEYWPLLVHRLAEHGARTLDTIARLRLMVGPFALLAWMGVPATIAILLQWVLSAATAVVVVVTWRSAKVGFDAKSATLLTAILLSAPYLWYYEAALMPFVALFMFRAGILTRRPADIALALALWIGGGLQVLNGYLDITDPRWVGPLIVTPVLVISLVLCLLHVLQARQPVHQPA